MDGTVFRTLTSVWLAACLLQFTCRFESSAVAQQSGSTQPFPRLEAAMHTAAIWRIAVDSKERFLVTASADKSARVWDLATGKLLTILRPPIGDDNEGKLYAVAISPDGSTIAVGGFTRQGGSNNFRSISSIAPVVV